MTSEQGFYSGVFRRHAHPLSAWSRVLSAPLLLLPLWTRRLWLYVPVGVWFAINPIMTPRVDDTSSFAARAILGEESWSRNPTSEPRILALSGAASAALLGAMVAAYQHRRNGAAAGTLAFMGITMCEWVLWADRFDRETERVPG